MTPGLQRLMLLHLARCEDLEVRETAVTHLDEARHHCQLPAFHPETGMLVKAEEYVLEGASLPIPVPALVGRTEHLYSGYRETTTPPSVR